MKVLLVCIPVTGHFNPILVAARILKEAGHETAIYTSVIFRDKVEKARIRFMPFPEDADQGMRDDTCALTTPFQGLRFQAVKWEPNGEIRELSPLKRKGDTVAFAFGINDRGQVVGSSGICSTQGLPPANVTGLHAVLWERDGSPRYLGTLGDSNNTMFNAAGSINDLGEVAGTSQFTDGTIHSFIWTEATGMQNLGTRRSTVYLGSEFHEKPFIP